MHYIFTFKNTFYDFTLTPKKYNNFQSLHLWEKENEANEEKLSSAETANNHYANIAAPAAFDTTEKHPSGDSEERKKNIF